ncbi:MAG: ABC transporter ATP-binding protein [Anaerolineae bacterium]
MIPPVLVIENLTFRYPDGIQALGNVSLQVQHGERVALLGANGAGKSTLLLHLNGVLRASSGSIQINGIPVEEKTLGKIRSLVGLVFQNPDDQLFSPHVYQDVAFGPLHMGLPESEVRARVEAALAAVGMGDYANRISHHLSGGEKKRAALATVLSMSPKLLALDEPTAGLDPRARRNLIALLKTLTEQTLLISTHDLPLAAELCTRVVLVEKGRIVADGAPEAILHDAALLEAHGL